MTKRHRNLPENKQSQSQKTSRWKPLTYRQRADLQLRGLSGFVCP